MTPAVVLLSGGLDSTAALLFAGLRNRDVLGVFVYYGQPALAKESAAAVRACHRLNVPLTFVDLHSLFAGSTDGLLSSRDSEVVAGKDTAFLPGRNAMLLSCGVTCGALRWKGEPFDVLVGCNQQDAMGFPDCRAEFLALAHRAFQAGGVEVTICSPWLDMTKREIVEWVLSHTPEHMGLLHDSWSCYRLEGPCGVCTACKARVGAFQ